MAAEDKCTLVPPSLCVRFIFLLGGPDSIFSESLRGPWTTIHAAAHPIKIKWSLRDSLGTDKLFVSNAWREKEWERKKVCLYIVSVCIPMLCHRQQQQQNLITYSSKGKWGAIAWGLNMLHWLLSKLLKETICFPALVEPIRSYSPAWWQCREASLIINVRSEGV